jgi:hypothetical protein
VSSTLDGTTGSAGATATSATFAAPATGTAAAVSVTVSGSHRVLVTITSNCDNTDNDSGCIMSFAASGALTQAASDNFAVGTARDAGPAPARNTSMSASYLLTIPNGTTTFTGQYRRGGGNTARFQAHTIIVQVY